MDAIDRAILNIIQEEFPLTEKPFEAIGRQVEINEKEALERVKKLKEEGFIRRIGLVLERKKLGYASLLCGVHIDDNRIEEVAGTISEEPGVTHNYERDGELNLWFTVTMKTIGDIDIFLGNIEKKYSLTIYRFPEKKTFKIKTYFPV